MMTEAEWLECTEPRKMLEFLRGRASDRKVRLLYCSYAKRVWRLFNSRRHLTAIETAERFSDGEASAEELVGAFGRSRRWRKPVPFGLRLAWMAPFLGPCSDWGGLAFTMDGRVQSTPCGLGHTMEGAEWTALELAGLTGEPDVAAVAAATPSGVPLTEAIAEARAEWEQQFLTEPLRSLLAAEHSALASYLRDLFGPFPFRQPTSLAPSILAWNDGTVRRLAQAMYDSRDFRDMPILADALLDTGCDDEELTVHCQGEGPHVRGCWAIDVILGRQ